MLQVGVKKHQGGNCQENQCYRLVRDYKPVLYLYVIGTQVHFAVLVQGQLVTCPSKYQGVTTNINSCPPTFSSYSY